jgi:MFS family permease
MRLWRILLIGLGTSVAALDTALNIAFPEITRAFDAPLPSIQWLVIAYVLTYASVMLAVGHLGDLADHRLVFRLGLAWSAAALAICASAPSYPILLAGRVAQGIGAALVLGGGPALLTGLFPETDRARALALYALMFSLAAAAGPILGGLLLRAWGWPAVFWFRAPIALLAALLLPALPRAAPALERPSRDFLGALLLGAAVASLLLVFDRLRHVAAGDFSAVLFGGFSFAAFAAFIRQERCADQPVLDLRLFRSPPFSAAHIASVLVNLAGFSVLLLLPYNLARMAGLSVALSGLVLAVPGAGAVAAAPLAAGLIRRSGALPVAASGALLSALGLALVAIARSEADLPWLAAVLAVQGIGLGLFQIAYMDLVMAAIGRNARGVAGSLALLSRTFGIASGASLLTLVYSAAEPLAATIGSEAEEPFFAAFRATFWFAASLSAAAGLGLLCARSSPRRG